MCTSGDCWWSREGLNGCRSAETPLPVDRPVGDDDPTSVADVYLGFTQVRLGAIGSDGMPSEKVWQDIGFDLDGVCTNSVTCDGMVPVSCRSPGPALPFDGSLCRDNSLGRLQPSIAVMPELDRFGVSENGINCQLWRGGYNMVVRLSGYNGKLDDPRVRVDYYLSTGLEEAAPWKCPEPNFTKYPQWRPGKLWTIDDSSLTAPKSEANKLPDSMFADADAYVKYGYLVARVPDGTPQGFVGDGETFRGFVFKNQQGVLTGRLRKGQDETWEMTDGLLGGRIKKDDLIQAYRESGFCETGDVFTFYTILLEYVNETLDVLASGEIDPEKDCDAISFGIGFGASQLLPGKAVKVPQRIQCCPPDVSIADCAQSCGDGKKTGQELCDTAIAPGMPGACPKSCPINGECQPQVLSGSGCMAECRPTPITMVGVKDGCCPTGATVTADSDCTSKCGNGVVESGETCDPPSSCVACRSSNRCLPVSTTGSAETCNLRCDLTPTTACRDGDGCCPRECSAMAGAANHDGDCSTTCNDQMKQENESCDNMSNQPCPPGSCADDDPCTRDLATGSAQNCSLQCAHLPITELKNGDGCCPDGASANSDGDCNPICGNGVVEQGEQCDDKNKEAGDGCVGCKSETEQQTCLMQMGDNACGQCICQKCAPQVANCYSDPKVSKTCAPLVKCSLREHCGTPDCFCGNISVFACVALGGASGPCKDETVAAAGTSVVLDLGARATDPENPLGRANALFSCVDGCDSACKATGNSR